MASPQSNQPPRTPPASIPVRLNLHRLSDFPAQPNTERARILVETSQVELGRDGQRYVFWSDICSTARSFAPSPSKYRKTLFYRLDHDDSLVSVGPGDALFNPSLNATTIGSNKALDRQRLSFERRRGGGSPQAVVTLYVDSPDDEGLIAGLFPTSSLDWEVADDERAVGGAVKADSLSTTATCAGSSRGSSSIQARNAPPRIPPRPPPSRSVSPQIVGRPPVHPIAAPAHPRPKSPSPNPPPVVDKLGAVAVWIRAQLSLQYPYPGKQRIQRAREALDRFKLMSLAVHTLETTWEKVVPEGAQPTSLVGTSLSTADLHRAFDMAPRTWKTIMSRFNPKEGLLGASTVLAWSKDPDAKVVIRGVEVARFTHLNSVLDRELLGIITQDQGGRYQFVLPDVLGDM